MADVRIEYICERQALACQSLGTGCSRQAHGAGVVFTDAASAPDTVTENKTKSDVIKSVTQRDY